MSLVCFTKLTTVVKYSLLFLVLSYKYCFLLRGLFISKVYKEVIYEQPLANALSCT